MKVKRLPVNSEPIDTMLDGGIEHNTLTNVYGPPGCGKTNFCIQTSISCIENNSKKVVYIDTEGGFSKERVSQIAEKPKDVMDNIILMEPYDFSEQIKMVDKLKNMCKNEDIGLVVLDSLVTLYRLKLNGKSTRQVNTNLANQLTILSRISRENEIPILVTNQIYSDIENGGKIELVSRDIAKYQSKCLIELKKLEKGKRIAILRKHRSLPEGKEVKVAVTEKGLKAVDKKFNIL